MKLLFALAAVALLLAGCSGGKGAVTPQMDAEGNYVIHMTAANRFTPANAKVPVGATVVWVNDGGVHDVTEHNDAWSSDDATGGGLGKKMQPGDRYERTFTAAGKVDYHCALHASTGMKATLTVEGDAAPAA